MGMFGGKGPDLGGDVLDISAMGVRYIATEKLALNIKMKLTVTFREAGKLQIVAAGSGFVRARLAEPAIAPRLAASGAWRAMLEGVMLGVLDLCGVPGVARIFEVPGEDDTVEAEVTWTVPA